MNNIRYNIRLNINTLKTLFEYFKMDENNTIIELNTKREKVRENIQEYKDNEASVFTLAATGSVDRVIEPDDTRAEIELPVQKSRPVGEKEFAEGLGFKVLGTVPSPIKGGDGNVEYLIRLGKGERK